MNCTTCEAPIAPGGRFCGACGSGVSRKKQTLKALGNKEDWASAARLASAVLGTSLALALIFGLASRPAFGQMHLGLKATVAWVAWVWESIFGVAEVGHAHTSGTLSLAGVSVDGNLAANGMLDGMPLTLTLITMVVAVRAFRWATSDQTSALPALVLATKTALLTAIPLLIVSLVVALNGPDLLGILHEPKGGNGTLASAVDFWRSLGSNSSLTVTISRLEAFFVIFALLLAVLAASMLTRGEWFVGRLRKARDVLEMPVRAGARLLLALVVTGLLYELVVWQVRMNTAWPPGSFGGRGRPPHFTVAQWIDYFAAAIAYGGNVGMAALGLGSGSVAGWATSGNATISGVSFSHSPDPHHGLAWWANGDHLAAGIWLALLITPAVLGWIAWFLARGRDLPTAARALAIWVISLLAAIPLLTYLANIAMSGHTEGQASVGWFGGSIAADGSAGFGLPLLLTTVTLVGYALVVSAFALAPIAIKARRLREPA